MKNRANAHVQIFDNNEDYHVFGKILKRKLKNLVRTNIKASRQIKKWWLTPFIRYTHTIQKHISIKQQGGRYQSRLKDLSKEDQLPSAHKQYLMSLKSSGFEPKVIYDIGSCVLSWTRYAKTLWPDAQFVLFDAFDKCEFLYGDYLHHMGVLSDEDGKILKFYQNNYYPTGNSYYREIGCTHGNYFPKNVYRTCVSSKLDTIVKSKDFPLPDFVKIDVQGAEKDIITGGSSTICNAQHLIVEMQHKRYNVGAPMAKETLPFIESLGYKCVAPLFCNNGPDGDYGFKKNRRLC